MSTLQDQLKKAGLVSEKPKQTKKKRKPAKVAKKERPAQQKAKVSEAALRAQTAMIKKAKHDRELNRQREAAKARKELALQVTQLIDNEKQDRADASLEFNFMHLKKVKKILVTEAQKKALGLAKLAIVKRPSGGFELVAPDIAAKVKEQLPKCFVMLSTDADETSQDDAYADYQVPDDLVW
ncbi:MAG: DUF2058 family protein [Pseudomonadota bacterium]